jgi:hypothetical protein
MSLDLDNIYKYHAPKEGQPEKYENIRGTAKEYAKKISEICPQSRELSCALTKLEEVVFWANAAVARN